MKLISLFMSRLINKKLILNCYNYPYNYNDNNKGLEMVAYAQNELASSTDISKQFGYYLSNVSNGAIEKLAILKNNKIEAVMIPTAIYESLINLLDEKEDIEILKTIEKRLETPRKDYLDGNEVLKKLNLSLDN